MRVSRDRRHPILVPAVVASLSMLPATGLAQMTDAELRAAAPAALELADVPDMQHILDKYVRNEDVAIALGKALFWDEAVGSDGQACASCHFHAGADNRSKNQLSPGLHAGDSNFDTPRSGGNGGVNYQLVDADFGELGVPKAYNDVVSSMGVHNRDFLGTQFFDDEDVCSDLADDVFNVGGTNVRRAAGRNSPSVINAVFNHRNFWDGRANNFFNGVTPLGARSNLDPAVGVWKAPLVPPFAAAKEQILEHNSSLASQAVGPPLSDAEMSCASRTFPRLGRKMLMRRALANQTVAVDDSHFTGVAPFGSLVHSSGQGLKLNYGQMVRMAFKPEWWISPGLVDGEFSQIEANFSLFWGLALQLYEAQLVSHMTPYDAFARGDDNALTEDQKRGLEVFLNEGQCIACHSGPEFTGATVRAVALDAVPEGETPEAMERMVMGNGAGAVYDAGFYNIGVRGTQEDLCIGADLGGFPLSFSRQASTGNVIDPEAAQDAAGEELPSGPVQIGERVAVDGACKTPGLRNVELTGPYFHNGGAATLQQVAQMYRDEFLSLFALDNIDDLDADILGIDIGGGDVDRLVAFMRSLTDERVRTHAAPFDHPSLTLYQGHPGDETGTTDIDGNGRADDVSIELPAVGAGGFGAAALPNFLNNCSDLDPNSEGFTDC